ncbi:MAG: hypothetical protein HN350_04495 [Phycisphaerales bacterium]|jgi:hypothetical protein|nr:hypothetical protein [Phycisphaerales bacterium]
MGNQDMNQAGLTGEFLADNEPAAQPETQETHQAIGITSTGSPVEDSASAQKRANLVLAVLFLAGMGVVYFMSIQGKEAPPDPMQQVSETIVDAAVLHFQAKSPTVKNADAKNTKPELSPVELAREMLTGTAKRQVPLKELKNNPFLLVPEQKDETEPVETVKTRGPTPGAEAIQKAEALKLQSIVIAKDRQLAIISDKLITVGQEIAGWTVAEIGNDQVQLKRKNLSFVLRLKK